MTSPKAIVGLGNPGSQYQGTYHNVGFEAVDRLVSQYETEVLDQSRGTWFSVQSGPVEFLGKPGEYVNKSGDVVKDWADSHSLASHDFLIVYDDFELDLGTIRLRPEGSSGGHRGMQSIIDQFSTRDIPRLRIGIGPLPKGMDVKQFVLADMTSDDRTLIMEILSDIPNIISEVGNDGIQSAMNTWNGVSYE